VSKTVHIAEKLTTLAVVRRFIIPEVDMAATKPEIIFRVARGVSEKF